MKMTTKSHIHINQPTGYYLFQIRRYRKKLWTSIGRAKTFERAAKLTSRIGKFCVSFRIIFSTEYDAIVVLEGRIT